MGNNSIIGRELTSNYLYTNVATKCEGHDQVGGEKHKLLFDPFPTGHYNLKNATKYSLKIKTPSTTDNKLLNYIQNNQLRHRFK